MRKTLKFLALTATLATAPAAAAAEEAPPQKQELPLSGLATLGALTALFAVASLYRVKTDITLCTLREQSRERAHRPRGDETLH